MHDDFDRCYRAVQSKDARFDGWFVTAVLTTRIYCRPSCPVRPPFARNVRFYPTAAAAQAAGFRACKRCRPDASPGSPEWNARGDVAARAMRLIADGTVDRDGVTGLAARLGYTTRQVQRILQTEVGANPLALARAQRAQTARVLIETTGLPFSDVAFAAGFSSIRQFNETVQATFDCTPTALRDRGRRRLVPAAAAAGTLTLRLPLRTPFAHEGVFGHLAASAVPGVEEFRDGAFRRTLRLPHGLGIVSLAPRDGHVDCVLTLEDLRDLASAIARCRRLLDLDADPEAVVDALGADPDLTALVTKAPGQRIPRTVDEAELAVRVVLGQQVSLKAARTHAARLAVHYGQQVSDPHGGLTHVFPTVEELADIDPTHLALPQTRRRTVRGLVTALATGELRLDPGCDWNEARARLTALPGIGPWTAEVIAMRGLGDPDAFPVSDLGVLTAARLIGLSADVRTLAAHSLRWRPWRAYATQHLWTALDHPVNDWPPKGGPTVTIRFRTIDSPVGMLTLAGRDGRLMHLRMTDQTYEPSREGWQHDHSAFPETAEQLGAYFAGKLTTFDLDLEMVGTPFQRRVWEALTTIPYGETRSYGDIARQIEAPGASRAVGLANGRNPISIIVPCHRVIGSNGNLTGYGGGIERKRMLLGMEKRLDSAIPTLFD